MIFSLSIDLDPLWCYGQIYGIDLPPDGDPITPAALERFLALCSELQISATIFAVGKALEDPRVADLLRAARAAGHEIANHSFSHPYDLSRLLPVKVREEIQKASEAIEKATGQRPSGFRAPGYILGKQVIGVLQELGFSYDSSILPSPPYQGIKALARSVLELSGKKSLSLPASFVESLAPSRPYRPDAKNPQRRGEARLLEIPVGTIAGLPLVGGLLSLAGESFSAFFGAVCARKAFVHLQIHGADLVDLGSDALPPQLGIQPDLKIPWRRKARAIISFCKNFSSTHRPLTLAEVAQLLAG